MRQKQPKNQIVIPQVTGPSEVEFTLTLEGTWDWNKDLAGPVYDPFTGPQWPHGFNQLTLKAAFQKLLSERVFDRCERMFETAQLTKATFTKEMESAFDIGKRGLSEQERVAAEKELAETEERAARLRSKLGKTVK
jgi:hypothetical protein